MRICIDSCVFIRGLIQEDPDATRLLDQIGPDLILMIPRLIAQEVTRNLKTPEQVRLFYQIFQHSDHQTKRCSVLALHLLVLSNNRSFKPGAECAISRAG